MSEDAALRAELDRVERRLRREHEIRREAESIAEQATRRLYDSDRLKSRFLETVSHELRTPLVAITGFTDVLADTWETLNNEQRLDYVERVRRNGVVLQTLIEQLLDFTRLDRGGFKLVARDISLSELVPKMLDQLEVVLAGRRARLNIEPDVDAVADAVAVTRILTNLLLNAITYSPEDTTVTIAVAAHDGWAVLEVADEGPGVPADEREFIFDRFYRGRHSTELRTHGTGIGLALVRELSEQMGGSAMVDDTAHGGARFSVLLPQPAPD